MTGLPADHEANETGWKKDKFRLVHIKQTLPASRPEVWGSTCQIGGHSFTRQVLLFEAFSLLAAMFILSHCLPPSWVGSLPSLGGNKGKVVLCWVTWHKLRSDPTSRRVLKIEKRKENKPSKENFLGLVNDKFTEIWIFRLQRIANCYVAILWYIDTSMYFW